tara:strand:- start:168 stop:725 length:558 start_codon:yes stop_codon:yes gene_type:complete
VFKKVSFFLIIFFFIVVAEASNKSKIISNLKSTENMTFNFEQTINDKTESGECTIKYPKKIYCAYDGKSKKIMVSTGKSLVIKHLSNGEYYIYPLKKTPLELILDKTFIISELENLEERIIENKYINFTLNKDQNVINIFFDLDTLQLIGWQTEDIYQNLVITFVSEIKLNQDIDKNIFNLPSMN